MVPPVNRTSLRSIRALQSAMLPAHHATQSAAVPAGVQVLSHVQTETEHSWIDGTRADTHRFAQTDSEPKIGVPIAQGSHRKQTRPLLEKQPPSQEILVRHVLPRATDACRKPVARLHEQAGLVVASAAR